MRWTEEDLQAFKKRAEVRGSVTTHTIAKEGEGQPENKRGGRKNKYGNIKAEAEGITFHSRKERTRWMDLRLEEQSGAIKNLRRQVAYPLEVNGIKVCEYIADHVYERGDALVVEDSKGYVTEVFRLKKKLMLAVHGIEIQET